MITKILTNIIDTKIVSDSNFRLEKSEEGKKIRELGHDISSKKLVYSQECSSESLEEIEKFIALYQIERKGMLYQSQTQFITDHKAETWNLLSYYKIETILMIRTEGDSKENQIRNRENSGKGEQMLRKNKVLKNVSIYAENNRGIEIEWNLSDNFRTCLQFINSSPHTKKVE